MSLNLWIENLLNCFDVLKKNNGCNTRKLLNESQF